MLRKQGHGIRGWLPLVALVVLVGAVIAGCGSSDDNAAATLPGSSGSSTTTTDEASTGESSMSEDDPALAKIPEELRSDYVGISKFYDVGDNPYADWTPPKPPWKICYNDSYAGNSWRKDALAMGVKLNQQLIDAGLSKGPMSTTNANNDVNTQVSQMNNQVAQGCQVILAQPASPTGLCGAIENAFKRGVLVVTIVGPAKCKGVINTDFNEYKAGLDTGKWLGEAIGGKGNVLIVGGIPGVASSEARTAGAKDGLAEHPDVKVAGEVAGQWTPSVGKTQTLKFLSTHPEKIDGVWQAALMMPAIGQAFEQLGRPAPKITAFAGECAELAYWHDDKLSSFGFSQGGGPAVYEAFYVANRMLAGAKPVTNLILYPLPKIDDENLDEWWKPDMTVNDTCSSVPPGGQRYVEDGYFDPLFQGGEEPKVTLQP